MNSSSNCTPILEYAGNPSIASIFILSILFNSLVILVILDMRKRKITSSTRLFVGLAVSDITMAVSIVLAAVINWRYDSCTFSRTARDGIHITTEIVSLSNKGITFYITLKRALAVSTKLKVSPSLISTVFEMIIFAVISCTPLFIDLAVSENKYKAIVWLVFFTLLTVVMAVLAFYILCKLRKHNKSMMSKTRHTRSTNQVDFQKLVFLVATTFTCCHFLAIVLYSHMLSHGFDDAGRSLQLYFFVGLAVNGAVNLFIYIAVSASFRRTLIGYFKKTFARSAPNVTQMSDLSSSASGSQQIHTST